MSAKKTATLTDWDVTTRPTPIGTIVCFAGNSPSGIPVLTSAIQVATLVNIARGTSTRWMCETTNTLYTLIGATPKRIHNQGVSLRSYIEKQWRSVR